MSRGEAIPGADREAMAKRAWRAACDWGARAYELEQAGGDVKGLRHARGQAVRELHTAYRYGDAALQAVALTALEELESRRVRELVDKVLDAMREELDLLAAYSANQLERGRRAAIDELMETSGWEPQA